MRIGIDARMYGAEATTGIGSYIKNLIDQIIVLDQENEYFIFLKEPAYSRFKVPNHRIKKIKINCRWYSLSEQLILPFILLKYRLNLVHFPHFNAAVLYPKKFLITVHDITPYFFPGPLAKKYFFRRQAYWLIFRLALWRAKKIITVSNHTKENLIKYFSVKPGKIEVTYLGIDQDFKIINDQSLINKIKEKYKISKPFIFYVGVWRDHKNLPNLIKAFTALRKQHNKNFQLVLGGRADNRYPEIQKAILNSQFSRDIITPGFIAKNDLPLLYNAAYFFVLPSFCEGFGLVALESIACGRPVISSKTTSLPEILGEAALYFDPNSYPEIADRMNYLISNKNLYRELIKRGQGLITRYSWRDCAKKTLTIYSSFG
jgi:hypothetical protein